MPIEVLRARVDHEVASHGQWFAGPRCCEGVVDDYYQSMLFTDCDHRFDVTYFEHGIGQYLDVENLRIVLNLRFVRCGVSHVSHRYLDAEAR